jgi:hypothetical protein
MTSATTADLVADYTARFSARYLHDHSVGSGLGIWLLLALLAPATEGQDRRQLETELGTDAEDASRRAIELLADPHPAVAAAVALWDRPEAVSDEFEAWAASLPPELDRGPMPTRPSALGHRQLGLIPTFPVEIDSLTLVVLASALASDVTWTWPLRRGGSRARWPARVDGATALRAPGAHIQQIVDTRPQGWWRCTPEAASGLGSSVIAAHAPPQVVHSATHGRGPARRRPLRPGRSTCSTSLSARPRGPSPRTGHLRRSRSTAVRRLGAAGLDHSQQPRPRRRRASRGRSHLPALHRGGDGKNRFEARQSAFADYGRKGFRAAAVTAVQLEVALRSR